MSDNTYASPEADIRPPAKSPASHAWSRILAVLNIIYGVLGLYCIFAIPLFISSGKLFAAAEAAERFERTRDPEDAAHALAAYHSASQLAAINWLIFFALLIVVLLAVLGIAGFQGITEAMKSAK